MLRINQNVKNLGYYDLENLTKPIIKDFLGELLLLNKDFIKIVPRRYNINCIEITLSSNEISTRKKIYFGGCGLDIVFRRKDEFEIIERER